MKPAIVFLVLASMFFVFAYQASNPVLLMLLVSGGLAYTLLSYAYFTTSPGIFLKRDNGSFTTLIYLLMWPFFIINHLILFLFRLTSGKPPFNEIVPGLYLGGRLRFFDKTSALPLQIRSVLDLTAEFREVGFLKNVSVYRCIPLLDQCAPNPRQLIEGVEFIQDQLSQGPVYVHCALGHSRSATFVAAYLLAARLATDPAGAILLIRNKRPGAHLNTAQAAALRVFAETNKKEDLSYETSTKTG